MRLMLVTIALWLVSATWTGAARADAAVAESLFREGREHMDNGDFERACAKFRASLEAEQSVGAMLNLGRCNERLGRIATAWAKYLAAASMARRADQLERESGARKLADALEERLPKLVVVVDGPVDGLVVKRDGEAVESAAFGSELPVDPGVHTIDAKAPGKRAWHGEVTLAEGERREIRVPALHDQPLDSEPDGHTPRAGGNGMLTAGAVLTAIGGAALVAGIAVGGKALADTNELDDRCPDRVCDGASERAGKIGRYADAATALLVIGGVVAALGISLVIAAPSDDRPEVSILPSVTSRTAGATLRLRF